MSRIRCFVWVEIQEQNILHDTRKKKLAEKGRRSYKGFKSQNTIPMVGIRNLNVRNLTHDIVENMFLIKPSLLLLPRLGE